uniref:SEFIR domain-containing protein n=1 Tax=Echeneis naucrates TaxID=173247 RepID=A0A665TE53_ECHNA
MKPERLSRNKVRCCEGDTQQSTHSNISNALWEIKYDCFMPETANISVSYSTTSTSCKVTYTVPDPAPEFELSVNRTSKSITVSVELGEKVYARWCYNREDCVNPSGSSQDLIDPSRFQSSVVLNVPYLLPCVCIQVYYTYRDARRNKKCPFQRGKVTDAGDVWSSSEVITYKSSLRWRSECPASDLKISASLCWRPHKHLCIPVLNSTLEGSEEGASLIFNTSSVDKHPNMCLQFSLQGSRNVSCPFEADMSSWDVYIGSEKQSLFVYLTSLVPAMFSAQFCVLDEMGCSPIGPVHTFRMVSIHVSGSFGKGVVVWRSDPALHGRRILCPVYTHQRYGLYAVAALILMVFMALLGIFITRLTKRGAVGWWSIQKPVLLVCSSDQSAHVSAVCALGSILQGELSATVHMALWAQSTQRQTGSKTAVTDLGPLPWLYGQWESVRKAQGKVLIIWSPEAKTAYENWREKVDNLNERKKEDGNEEDVRLEKMGTAVKEDYKLDGGLTKCKKEKARGRKECVRLCDGKDCHSQKEASSVTAPVFAAALSCLQGTLQQGKGQGVAIVYFQGLGHSKDIPKAYRSVPWYCLPQDFRGLIEELGGMKRRTQTGKFRWHCWSRLVSKVRSIGLARRLTQTKLKLPLTASRARPKSVQVQEAPYVKAKKHRSQVSPILPDSSA